MKHNIVASIAVFQSLYNNKQDIYSVLVQFNCNHKRKESMGI